MESMEKFRLGLAEWRGVANDDDDLGLSGAEGLEGRLDPRVTVMRRGTLAIAVDVEIPVQKNILTLPDFITSARRELMLSAASWPSL